MKIQGKHFLVLDGIRGFLSIWVMGCHTIEFLYGLLYLLFYNSLFVEIIDDNLMKSLINSFWPKILVSLGYQVDLFFLLSSFLFSLTLLSTNNEEWKESWLYGILKIYLKRVFRLWPLLIVSIFFTIWMKDYNSNNYGILSYLLLFPLDERIPITFTVCWSIGVDFFNSIILYSVWRFLQKKSLLPTYSSIPFQERQKVSNKIHLIGLTLIILSLIPRILLFSFSHSPFLNYESLLISKDMRIQFFIPQLTLQRISVYINEIFPEFLASQQASNMLVLPELNPIFLEIAINEAVIFFQRMTPFFVGFYLALVYRYQVQQQPAKEERNTQGMKFYWFHGVLLLLSWLILFHPIAYGFDPRGKADDLHSFSHLHRPEFSFLNESQSLAKMKVDSASTWNVFQLNCNELLKWKDLNHSDSTLPTCSFMTTIGQSIPIELTNKSLLSPFSEQREENLNEKTLWTIFFSVMNRPLYSMAMGYLLFRLLLQSTTDNHPLYQHLSCPSIASFFQWKFFRFIGEYSYGIYLVHTRWILEVMMKYLPIPSFLAMIMSKGSGTTSAEFALVISFLVYFILSFGLSIGFSVIATKFIDEPIQRKFLQPLLRRWFSSKNNHQRETIEKIKSQ